MSIKDFVNDHDTNSDKKYSGRGRPFNTKRTPEPEGFMNIPLTKFEKEAIDRIAEKNGSTKRAIVKRWIQQGIMDAGV
ncbi:MAG: hypothetical protein AB8G05_27525 [Oligoflexales bacterium]